MAAIRVKAHKNKPQAPGNGAMNPTQTHQRGRGKGKGKSNEASAHTLSEEWRVTPVREGWGKIPVVTKST